MAPAVLAGDKILVGVVALMAEVWFFIGDRCFIGVDGLTGVGTLAGVGSWTRADSLFCAILLAPLEISLFFFTPSLVSTLDCCRQS